MIVINNNELRIIVTMRDKYGSLDKRCYDVFSWSGHITLRCPLHAPDARLIITQHMGIDSLTNIHYNMGTPLEFNVYVTMYVY